MYDYGAINQQKAGAFVCLDRREVALPCVQNVVGSYQESLSSGSWELGLLSGGITHYTLQELYNALQTHETLH